MTKQDKSIPKQIKNGMRQIGLLLIDSYEYIFGFRDKLSPPKRLVNINDGDSKKIGEEFLQYFINIGGLKSTDSVLDVGCGFGRMARPLTNYLSDGGKYEGFDILTKGVNWCAKNFTPRFPNFHFQLIDVYNARYNPKGNYVAAEYKFPFEDNSFDFIFLTSVFTHMLPKDIENYMSEISRVLKKDGKCLITYFVLNNDSRNQIDKNESEFSFKYKLEDYSIEDDAKPEYAVAYEEENVRNLYNRHGINIIDPIHYGSWSGRKDFLSFQDIIVGTKR
jgi:SAM-dependent methyltransferase